MDRYLNTLLENLEKEKTELERQGKSFSSASLFSAFHGLTNSKGHCHSSDFEKIMDISIKLTNVNSFIEFCETILRKMESTEPLNPNENTFLDYISMISQILEMTLEVEKIHKLTNLNFEMYKNTLDSLIRRISNIFDAFMKFMTYHSYSQCIVQDKKRPWETKKSGAAKITSRIITPTEQNEIQGREDEKNGEIKRLSNEYQDILRQKDQFLERFCQLLASVSKPIRTFGLKSSPELSFFLSGFDSDHFETFFGNFQMIDEKFQLFKTEIDSFNQHMESLRKKYLEECNEPDEYLDNWKFCISKGKTFYGKKD